jgi:TorA maturation chaperone TorD
MPAYKAPLRDFDFVLNEVIQVQNVIPSLPGYEEATQDVFASYLEAAAKFCENELAPINRAAEQSANLIAYFPVRLFPCAVRYFNNSSRYFKTHPFGAAGRRRIISLSLH